MLPSAIALGKINVLTKINSCAVATMNSRSNDGWCFGVSDPCHRVKAGVGASNFVGNQIIIKVCYRNFSGQWNHGIAGNRARGIGKNTREFCAAGRHSVNGFIGDNFNT